MDGLVVLDSENCSAGENKRKGEKMAKGSAIGKAPRKRLADISNLQQQQQQPKLAIQHVKQQIDSLTTKEYVDNLHKENMMLMQLLADRNKIIELSRVELQNLRINLQKVQQQNLKLAQANSQMLAELNSGKDRLRALQHELGCKNGLLKVTKMEAEENAKRAKCHNMANKVGSTKCVEAGESSQANKDSGHCNTNRRRQSKNLSLGPPTVEAVQAQEKADNKRCLRRQSARFKAEELEATEDLFEVKDDKKRQLRRQSARFTTEEVETTEDLLEINDDNKRRLRRQSARFKTEEVEATEDLREISDDNKRQSARFKTEEVEATEDLLEISADKFPVSPQCDDVVHESGPTCSPVKKEDEGNAALRSEGQEFRRSSIRPLRRAAEKVKSYKEIPINVKMRQ